MYLIFLFIIFLIFIILNYLLKNNKEYFDSDDNSICNFFGINLIIVFMMIHQHLR